MSPQVSVLMPVRDGERYRDEALASVRAQTLTDFELVVVDDGSRDATRSILEAWDDPRLVIVDGPGQGISRALNAGLEVCRADLVARMDADDSCPPERLRTQAAYLDAHPEVGLVACSFEAIDAEGRHEGYRGVATADALVRSTLAYWNPFCHGSVMVRRHLVEEVGRYDPATEPAEDYDLWVRLADVTRLAALPDVLYRHRGHGTSISAQDSTRQVAAAAAIADRRDVRQEAPSIRTALAVRRGVPDDAPHRQDLLAATSKALEQRGRLAVRDGRRREAAHAVLAWLASRPPRHEVASVLRELTGR